MVAIITDAIKLQMMQDVFDDLADSASSSYYLAVAKSEEWNDSDTPITPVNSQREQRNFRLGTQAVKRITDFTFTVPRYNWSFGAVYSAYSDNVAGYPLSPYYVITEDNAVYICIKQSKTGGIPNPSSVKPTGTSTTPFTTSDGYIWKFLYTIGTLNASKFLTANYMPVQKIDTVDSDSLAVEIEQKTIQDAAIPGEISGLRITTGGVGYDDSPPPTISIVGNGTGATGLVTVTNGVITAVELDESAGSVVGGTGFDYAECKIIGGGSPSTAAVIQPIIGPKNGFGADPRIDLKSSAIMFNVIPDSDEEGEWVIGNAFRQLGIIRNPKVGDLGSDSDFTGAAGNTLKSLQFASISSAYTVGSTIVGASSGAKGIIDKIIGTGNASVIYYHQTEATGFTDFQEAESVTEQNGLAGSGVLKSAAFDADSRAWDYPTVDPFSGELLYIDNRAKIDRLDGQAEDIKVIIQL